MGLSLSTSWNAFRYTKGDELIFEIKKCGFEEVELSFNLTSSMVGDILSLTKNGLIKISSLHNFCPIPDNLPRETALPDCYSMSSTDEEIRRSAVKYSKRTIETAKELNASAVVLHTGRTEIPDKMKNLIKLYNEGFKDSAIFIRLRDEIIKERRTHSRVFFENTLRSLDEINQYAVKSDISLGVETRFYYREIPNFEEIGKILNYFKNGNIFYWHDTGHAQVMENLGFVKHKDFLAAYGANILGFHLHNVSGCDDHKPPSQGEIQFESLLPYIKKDTLTVIEAHSPAAADDLIKSKALLAGIFSKTGWI